MRVSEILNEGVEKFLDLTPAIENHLENTDNPHGITKEKIGLGNVTDDLQAKETDFRSHQEAAVLDHPAGSVTTEKLAAGAVTAEKIAEGAVGSGALAKGCVADEALSLAVRKTISEKVNRENGMGLSQNNFTNEEKAKLAAITVVDEEQHVVDTTKFMLNTLPLRLCKAGMDYTYGGERVEVSDIKSLITVEVERENGDVCIVYWDINDVYTLKWYHGSITRGWEWYTIKAPANTACHFKLDGEVYFAIPDGNTVTIKRAWYYNAVEGKYTDYGTFTLSQTESQTDTIEVRHIFANNAGVRIVYFKHISYLTVLYVDSFERTDCSLLWTYNLNMQKKSDYAEDDTVYNSRFRSVIWDAGENSIYIGAVPTTSSKYSIIRLNEEGTVTGRYSSFPMSSIMHIPQDITRIKGKLYAFKKTKIHRFDPETARQDCIWIGESANLRGFDVDDNGVLHLLTERTNGETALHMVQADREGQVNYYPPLGGCKKVINGIYLLARYTPEGVRLYSIPEGTTQLVSHLYVPTDVYTIL